ncbi:hypothetical protein O3G_MSEX012628 [Manduca sexta]|uniref:Glucosylceramidase n=1 Tax=Manduca sexta TaxID=7130 RepID=A0A921ZQ70_MANSE|nr:hypothetical protein O3G_MSEX012628 [Manduca sexta]
MIRVPIGGTDFSTHPYAYNEIPENDAKLSNFSLTFEDYEFKIPLIKKAFEASKSPIHLIATTWSPPPWMKTNRAYTGVSHLKTEFYQTYADYHYKFLEKYAEVGVPIWAITTTNEPISGALGVNAFNTLGWTASAMGKWISENLGPTIRNSTFKNLKILVADDQRIVLPYYFNIMLNEHPNALQYIDGIAVHYYSDFITPAIILTEVNKNYPHIFIIATEACEGSFKWERERVSFGSWQRGRNYINDIIEDLNHNVVGWMDWNICLNQQGGPTWAENNVDSPILVNAVKDEFYKQPMFYAMGHFSKFIPRGSRRIKVTEKKFFFEKSVENVAFLTPNNTIVVVMYNDGHEKNVWIKFQDKQAVIKMTEKSITTIIFSNSAN